jgi:hypothetical protein
MTEFLKARRLAVPKAPNPTMLLFGSAGLRAKMLAGSLHPA